MPSSPVRTAFLRLALLVGGSLASALPTLAATPAAAEATPPPSLVFPVFDMAPWSYFDPACRPRGIAVESLQAIASRADLPLALRLSAAPERPGMAKVGALPVFDIDLRVVPAPGVVLPGISALAGRRIGMDRDETRIREQLEALGAEAVPFEDYPDMVDAMLAGRLDGVAGLREGLVYALRHRAAGPELLGRNIALRRDPVWLHLGANAPADWSLRLRDAVGHFVGSGRFGTLRDRYLSRAAHAPFESRKDCAAGG